MAAGKYPEALVEYMNAVKKDPASGGVCYLADEAAQTVALARLDLGDVWGIGHRLQHHLSRFELLPRQLVHGDWTPRNVLFNYSDGAAHVSAVLDFEAMAIDPVHVDLSNTCSTLLIWSGLDRVGDRINEVLTTYEEMGGVRVELSDVHTAMLAHWLCHYWGWRDRLELGEFGQDVKERLCLRIESVLDYLGGSVRHR